MENCIYNRNAAVTLNLAILGGSLQSSWVADNIEVCFQIHLQCLSWAFQIVGNEVSSSLRGKKEHIHFAEGSIIGNGFSMLYISLCVSWILLDIFVVTWGFPNGGCANICSASFSPRVSGKTSWEISRNQVTKFILLPFHKFWCIQICGRCL